MISEGGHTRQSQSHHENDHENSSQQEVSSSQSNKNNLGGTAATTTTSAADILKKKAAVLEIGDLEVLDGAIEDGDQVVESGEEFMKKFQRLIESRTFSVGMKAKRIIEVLQDVLSRSFLMSRHIAIIIDCFRPFGEQKATAYFGTYNVELVITFFDKIIDMHNFDVVLNRLTAFEVACLYCRLGILSIYNPAKPEGGWELNMSRWYVRTTQTMLTLYTLLSFSCIITWLLLLLLGTSEW